LQAIPHPRRAVPHARSTGPLVLLTGWPGDAAVTATACAAVLAAATRRLQARQVEILRVLAAQRERFDGRV
jgi:hypothetical protein